MSLGVLGELIEFAYYSLLDEPESAIKPVFELQFSPSLEFMKHIFPKSAIVSNFPEESDVLLNGPLIVTNAVPQIKLVPLFDHFTGVFLTVIKFFIDNTGNG